MSLAAALPPTSPPRDHVLSLAPSQPVVVSACVHSSLSCMSLTCICLCATPVTAVPRICSPYCGTRWPTFEGCPAGGPVLGSSEAWWSLGAGDGGGGLAPLAFGVLPGKSEFGPGLEFRPRLVYMARGQSGGACTRPLWAQGCRVVHGAPASLRWVELG